MMTDAPVGRDARVEVLLTGSLRPRVRSSCTLVREGDLVAVVDPGLAPSAAAILDPLQALGLTPGDVTAVVLSHHHPDHTLTWRLQRGQREARRRGRFRDRPRAFTVLRPLSRTPGG